MTADLSALIARLEAAEVGSRELDAEIARAMGWEVHNARRNGLWVVPFGEHDTCDPEAMFALGNYTTSLDAALALAERVLDGWRWSVQQLGPNYEASLTLPNGVFLLSSDTEVYAIGKNPALALCIAILKAKQGEG